MGSDVVASSRKDYPHFRTNKDLNEKFEFIPRCKQRGIQNKKN